MTDRFGEEVSAALPAARVEQKPLSDLYGHYRKELVAFVRLKFGQGPPEPEDVAQQAFANFAALGPANVVANPRAFLYRTAYNIALNYRKRERIGRRFFEQSPDPAEIREARDDFNPEVVLLSKEQYALIERVIRAMPLQRRQFLLLNRLEGLSYAEIARRMGRAESVVRKQVALAIRECGAALLRDENVGGKSASEAASMPASSRSGSGA